MEKNEILFRLSRPFKISRTGGCRPGAAAGCRRKRDGSSRPGADAVLLADGLLQVLDKEGKPLERYFIKGGVADVARNRCAVSTEKVVAFDKIDLPRAAEKRDEAILPDDKVFYQMIVDYLTLMSSHK